MNVQVNGRETKVAEMAGQLNWLNGRATKLAEMAGQQTGSNGRELNWLDWHGKKIVQNRPVGGTKCLK